MYNVQALLWVALLSSAPTAWGSGEALPPVEPPAAPQRGLLSGTDRWAGASQSCVLSIVCSCKSASTPTPQLPPHRLPAAVPLPLPEDGVWARLSWALAQVCRCVMETQEIT